MVKAKLDLMIVPFRGEYYDIVAAKQHYVKGLIYPVPDPRFPFLGVHFTKRIGGGVEAGPNAVLAFKREGYSKKSFQAGDVFEFATFPGFWRMAAKTLEDVSRRILPVVEQSCLCSSASAPHPGVNFRRLGARRIRRTSASV